MFLVWGVFVRMVRYADYSLARFTSLRIGGPADDLLIPNDLAELVDVVQTLPSATPITFLGLGSNTLIRETGLRGLVVILQGSGLTNITSNDQGIFVEAGVACGQLARFAARNEWHGLSFMAGIPGTVGGALAMNAGCYGSETWDHVQYVQTLDRKGCVHHRDKAEFAINYRQVNGIEGEMFLAAQFVLPHGDKIASLAQIKQWLAQRQATQPIDLPNCGSVFRNPLNDYAARLIEACGLKGRQIGGAQISEKHANFIVNKDHATADDVLALIALMRRSVKEQYGVYLETEVKVLG